MIETFIIIFREGLEAFLLVAIMLAYLSKTGQKKLFPAVYWGIGIATLISATTAWHIAELAKNPIMEGLLAIAAGILVASLTVTVMRSSKNIKENINDTLELHSAKTGHSAMIGVFFFTVLMIIREGMETAMLMGPLSVTLTTGEMLIGALLGLLAVGVIGIIWIYQSNRINLKLFMQITGVFLIGFCIYLFAYGFHELIEALE